jgi:biopolymer transport protein ExbD
MASGGGEEGEFGLQIAPMLDVMFVLLLFFMVSAGSNAKEEELGIKLPGNSAAAPTPGVEVPIVLKITEDGSILFNDSSAAAPDDIEMKGLQERLKDTIKAIGAANQPVIISPDPKSKHDRVIRVMDACSYAGVEKLAFRYVAAPK